MHKLQMLETAWRQANTLHCWRERKLVQPLETAVRRFRKKLTTAPHAPAVPLLGIHLEKITIQKDTCTPVFTAALFTIAETWKQPKCPSAEEWIKMWYMYAMEYHSAIKESEIMPFAATWMDPEIIILSEVRGEPAHDIPYIWNLKRMIQMNLLTKLK